MSLWSREDNDYKKREGKEEDMQVEKYCLTGTELQLDKRNEFWVCE